MTGILGYLGAFAIGVAGAVTCGFGGAVPLKVWPRWFRDPECVGVSAIVLFLLLFHVYEWYSGRGSVYLCTSPFIFVSIVVGVLIRCSFEACVWLYGLLRAGNSDIK